MQTKSNEPNERAARAARQADEAARTSEAHLRAVYDGTYEYIGLITPDGRVLDCNRASLEFVGDTRENVIGEYLWDTQWFSHTPGEPERVRAGIERAAAGEFVRYRTTLHRPDDDPLTFDFSLHPVRNEAGDVVFIVPEGRDITESQRTESALRRSEARYRTLFESIDEGFCVIEVLFDEDGQPHDYVFHEANPAFVEQTGLRDAVGRRIRELVPNHEPHWYERYGQVARTGQPKRFQAEARGLSRIYDVYAFRIGAPEERKVAVLFQDITAARAAELERERLLATLQAEREHLVEVIRRAPAFMVVLRGPDHVIDLANDEYLRFVGQRDVVGRPLFDAVPDAREQGFEDILERVVATCESFVGRGLPIMLQRTAGAPPEERIMDLACVPLLDADGRCSSIVVHGTDVTDQVSGRRDAERARDRAERLQALTAALAEARTVDDVADVVVNGMVESLGARTGALAARAASDEDAMVLLRTTGFPEQVKAGVKRQRLDLESPLTECYRTRSPVWIEQREGAGGLDARYPPIAPVWDALQVRSAAFVPLITGGETVGVISFAFEDSRSFEPEERAFLLTLGQQAALAMERARLFEAERAARSEAERANRAKSEFLAVMSHELRTPLNAIGGYAQLMEMGVHGPLSEQQAQDVDRIQQSQRHLLGLINEVLNYAKLEARTVHYRIEEVALAAVFGAAESLVAPQAQAGGIALTISMPPADLLVRADMDKVRQILVNLLSNALKFTPNGGRVDLTWGATGDAVHVIVRDTGIGIPADRLEQIFEPFVQVRADLTRTAEGAGLGLAISRDLARGMGGDLTAESEPGAGSTFMLTLARAAAFDPADPAGPPVLDHSA